MKCFQNMQWSPIEYAESAVIAAEAADEMLARLDWMTLQPQMIIDLGCGIGDTISKLQARYPQAHVIGVDTSEAMLQHAKGPSLALVCADALRLPLRDQSVDLIFANFLLPWMTDFTSLLHECRRLLRPDGLFMLSGLGPDTLRELLDGLNPEQMPYLMDMHDVGDLLLRAGFADPVLDVNYYTTTYRSKEKLAAELIASGMLSSTASIDTDALLPAEDGRWHATYEVFYAHGFGALKQETTKTSSGEQEVRIPVAQLKKIKQKKY